VWHKKKPDENIRCDHENPKISMSKICIVRTGLQLIFLKNKNLSITNLAGGGYWIITRNMILNYIKPLIKPLK